MQRTIQYLACVLALCLLTACAAGAEERMGQAEGYGGTLKVTVTVDGGKISKVAVTEHHETEGVGTKAIDALPQKIVQAGSADVDAVSGATVTSDAIMAAVRDAMGETASAAGSAAASPETSASPEPAAENTLSGVGMTALGRVGPGKDDTDTQVYSFNVVFAQGTFTQDGRIVSLNVDQLEVATPNYDGASMPHLSGFPGQGGYNLWDDQQGKVAGKSGDTEDDFLKEIAGWNSKRARGDEYKMTTGTWSSQMDAYQRLFAGKTVDEVEKWYKAYCSDVNGRPLKADSGQTGDAEKYAALSESDKTMLTDVTSSATMSLSDHHGDIIGAIRAAWENAKAK